MKRLLALFGLLLSSSLAWGANVTATTDWVCINSLNPGGGFGSATIDAGTNRKLIVIAGMENATPPAPTLTVGGQNPSATGLTFASSIGTPTPHHHFYWEWDETAIAAMSGTAFGYADSITAVNKFFCYAAVENAEQADVTAYADTDQEDNSNGLTLTTTSDADDLVVCTSVMETVNQTFSSWTPLTAISNGGVPGTGGDQYYGGAAAGNGDSVTITPSGTADATTAACVVIPDAGGGAPTFSSPPALDDCDSDSCIFDFTPSGSADLHWAAYTTGASAPADCAAVDAASGAEEAGEEAVTGADSVDIPSVMVQQDYYFCLENGSGTSAVASVLNQNRDARAGYEITTLTSIAATSIFDLDAYFDPDVALDIVESEADTNENAGCLVNFEVDGDFVLVPSVAGDCDGRPTFEYCIQDTSDSTGEFTTPACWTGGDDTVYVNNTPPTLIEGEFASLLIEVDVAMTPIALATRWEDVDGDAVTVTFQDSLPSGLTNNAGSLEGTPDTLQVFTEITERATDAAGDFTEVEIEIAIGVRLPDVTAWLLDESLWNTTSIFGVNDDYFNAPQVVGW